MKLFKMLIATLIFVLFFHSPSIMANQERTWEDWNYFSPIQLDGSNKYKAIFLPEEIYAHALPNLADLRIVDNSGAEVPYYIQTGKRAMEENRLVYDSSLIARKQKDNDTIIDFKIEPIRENSDIMGNKLQFTLPNQEFLKHLHIQGGYDGNNWVDVAKDYLYQTAGLQKSTITLDQTYKYNYFRVTILDNAEKISLSELQLVYEDLNASWQSYEKTKKLSYEMIEMDKETQIKLANPQHLKLKEIFLEIDGNFQRAYTVYDADNKRIRTEGDQEIYKLNFKEINITNTNIKFAQPEATDQFTIKVIDHDNPALDIKNVSINYYLDKLVFEDRGSGPYKLYYGKETIQPQYDLTKFKEFIENEEQDKITLGPPVKIAKETAPKTNWFNSQFVFNAVVILVSIALVSILIRKLNKSKK